LIYLQKRSFGQNHLVSQSKSHPGDNLFLRGYQMESSNIGSTLQNAISNLPKTDADLKELIAFCRQNDPSREFEKRWGSEYRERVRELWGASTYAFKSGQPTGYSPDELLMCMAYDVIVAPYIGVPEDISHSYLQTMLRELREKI
jgi:hypothetical protein